MTRMETRGERLARKRHQSWGVPDQSILDLRHRGLYPETERADMPKRKTFVEPPVSYAPFWIVLVVLATLLSVPAAVLVLRWVGVL
jgi:hypothetical protein